MRAILDTHAFLWALAGDRRMSQKARDLFKGPSDLFLSIVSVWEIVIKVQSGKLPLPRPSGPFVMRKLAENRIEVLPIHLDHLLAFENLPLHHRDPFDRMLVAQSIHERLPLITMDPQFEKYSIQTIW